MFLCHVPISIKGDWEEILLSFILRNSALILNTSQGKGMYSIRAEGAMLFSYSPRKVIFLFCVPAYVNPVHA